MGCGHILSPRMLSLVRLSSTNLLCPPGVVVELTTETNMEPNEINFWGTMAAPASSPSNCHVCLLFLVALSRLFLSLLIFVVFSCRLLFLSSLSSFLPVAARFGRLRDEHGTQHISKNKSRPFRFQFFPHHRPGTRIVF